MKNIYYIILSTVLLFVTGSCSDDREDSLGDQGQVLFLVSVSDSPQVGTRASDLPGMGDWDPAANCSIQIMEGAEVIHTYTGLQELPSSLTLAEGEYTIKVTAGQEVAASFTSCYYEAESTFNVTKGETQTVTLKCKLKNVLVTIRFTETLKSLIEENFQVFVIGEQTGNVLGWKQENAGDTGYFILSEAKDLIWSVEGIVNGKNLTKGGLIPSVKPNTNYILTFNYDEGGSVEVPGDIKFTLEIVEPDAQDDVIDYIPETEIGGDGFDMENPEPIDMGSEEDIVVNVTSHYAITSFLVSVDEFTKSAFGLTNESFDFMQMDESEIANYATKGIVFQSTSPTRAADSDQKFSLTIAGWKIKELGAGDYSFGIQVTNEKNTVTAQLNLPVVDNGQGNNIQVSTDNIVEADVWAKRATLKGTLIEGTSEDLSFDYRIKTTSTWTSVAAQLAGSKITAELSGLQDGITYEYCVKAGDQAGEIKEFTTESATQLPNSGFEIWGEETKRVPPYLFPINKTFDIPAADGNSKFWDCGNWGAAAAGAKLTQKSTDYRKSGEYSAILESKEAKMAGIGRFAAGNIFTGEFVEILYKSSAANAGGRLNFGREFTSRPTALKGWYKYTSGGNISVDKNVTLTDAIKNAIEADPRDKANIYIALSDKGAPYEIVNTTTTGLDLSFFEKNDENIIAYGEFIQPETTDGLQEFTINLEYYHLDRKPTHIIVLCSSSIYGDYFSGAVGSTLWLDDFELIYE